MDKTEIEYDLLQLIGDAAVMVERANLCGNKDQARKWAIAKTELEKNFAWIYTYCETVERPEEAVGTPA
jgi:hypothetical protein